MVEFNDDDKKDNKPNPWSEQTPLTPAAAKNRDELLYLISCQQASSAVVEALAPIANRFGTGFEQMNITLAAVGGLIGVIYSARVDGSPETNKALRALIQSRLDELFDILEKGPTAKG